MNRKDLFLRGALTGVITAIGVTALFYIGNRLAGLPFVPFDVFDWLSRQLPGPLITAAIETMVRVIRGLQLGPTASLSKLAEQSLAVIQFVVAGGIFGFLVALLGARYPSRIEFICLVGAVIFLAGALLAEASLGIQYLSFLSSLWIALLLFGWAWVLSRMVMGMVLPADQPEAEQAASRRRFLAWVWGGSLALALAAIGLSRPRRPGQVPVTSGVPAPTQAAMTGQTSGPAASPSEADLAKRIQPVPGTRAEVTPTDSFYRIDINLDVPQTDVNAWRLALDGLVNTPLSLTLEQIRAFPATSQMITLSCISNEVGGDLISTGLWTGVPLKTVLAAAGLKPGAAFINIRSFDGFYESLGMAEAMDERTLLVYDMNGAPLPPEHGYPLRIFIPNHYGMKQPKWIEHMEVSDTETEGFWVERGWSKTAIPRTTSVIDTAGADQQNTDRNSVPVGGIAYAGARGISRVEVQMDNGPWAEAELRVPPLSPLTWVQWRYNASYQSGRHIFRVRAYDGDGKLQETNQNPPHPNGATGIDFFQVDL